MEFHTFVDAKGLACPMPVVKAKKAIEGLQPGQIMLLETADRGSLKDFQGWVNRTLHKMLKVEEEEGLIRFWVERAK